MIRDEIKTALAPLRDEPYRALQITLIPTVRPESIIGVRTPALRQLAKRLLAEGDVRPFLEDLPHAFFEENQLHAFMISEIRDFAACLDAVESFLPRVDNWATCDQLSPRAFRRHRQQLLPAIRRWMASGQTYMVRFGIRMLMDHFLDDGFAPEYPAMVAAVRSEEYYVRMMAAWYFATALAKQYEAVLPYIAQRRLDPWTHHKAIQKAIESRRVSPERKEALRALRT